MELVNLDREVEKRTNDAGKVHYAATIRSLGITGYGDTEVEARDRVYLLAVRRFEAQLWITLNPEEHANNIEIAIAQTHTRLAANAETVGEILRIENPRSTPSLDSEPF